MNENFGIKNIKAWIDWYESKTPSQKFWYNHGEYIKYYLVPALIKGIIFGLVIGLIIYLTLK